MAQSVHQKNTIGALMQQLQDLHSSVVSLATPIDLPALGLVETHPVPPGVNGTSDVVPQWRSPLLSVPNPPLATSRRLSSISNHTGRGLAPLCNLSVHSGGMCTPRWLLISVESRCLFDAFFYMLIHIINICTIMGFQISRTIVPSFGVPATYPIETCQCRGTFIKQVLPCMPRISPYI